VVTTGQQPGLFGGPLYTLYKAIAAGELARELEQSTGVPAMAVFWAATDDADFAEASETWVRALGGAQRLVLPGRPQDGTPLSEVPLPDMRALLDAITSAADSAIDLRPLDLLREAYAPGQTVGGAYVHLMRGLLEPLGIAVLDASHPAVLAAERGLLTRALEAHDRIDHVLREREGELIRDGFSPQVAHVANLSLVFEWHAQGKVRVPREQALATAAAASARRLSPNVLLRPVVEGVLLPTVAYVAGPGELSYFPQVAAVAEALDERPPLSVPRWSATVLEPDVLRLLDRHGIAWRELDEPHVVERRLARAALPTTVLKAFAELRGRLGDEGEALKGLLASLDLAFDLRIVDGTTRGMRFRLDRLERRLVARVKRQEAALMRDVGTLRGALFPDGRRQERALNFVPLLAAHGRALVAAMQRSARRHAHALVHGLALPRDA
jgi:bacillithiol biosynthesis cysteine-adding enzyme BshC